MDDNALDRLFSGDLDKLIPLPKRVVRLFISSTFTDMTLERNSLMERVYPRLKKYCRERFGLDFQVVDMRWGVRDEATDDHQTVNLCSREIDNCQRMSLGPNFVALLGDKYGFRPLCNRIKSSEYRALRRCLIELDINTDFLDAWYKEDLNAVPPEYLLQPISSILKNFTNKKQPELQSVDQRIWQAIQERLHELLMIGSGRLVKQGRMSEKEQLMKYSISVTEREVIEGCLDVNDAKSHCLVYVRSILDLKQHLDDCLAALSHQSALSTSPGQGSGDNSGGERRDSAARKASLQIGDDAISLTTVGALNPAERRVEKSRKLIGKYIDLNSKENTWRLDEGAQKALANLKEVKLGAKLKPNGRNLKQYKVLWNEQEGIGLKSDEHKHYLNELVEHFYSNITRMIRKASTSEQEFKSGLIGEVLQHSHYAKHVSKTFHGRSEELDKIRAYILSEPDAGGILPMFIYGVGGSGKTSILARAATLAKDWISSSKSSTNIVSSGGHTEEERWDEKPCIIMRFCCTTPSSSSMVGVLTSVCRQLQFNFYQFGPMNGVVNNQQQQQASASSTSAGKVASATPASTGAASSSVAGLASADQQLPYQPIPEDFVRLIFTFRQLLENCQHHYHRKRLFLIVLDSVEHLTSPAESSVVVKYSWLTSIAKLPPNVRLIVSCSSERTSEAWNEDYLHLKRHFLLSYYVSLKQSKGEGSCDSNGVNSMAAWDEAGYNYGGDDQLELAASELQPAPATGGQSARAGRRGSKQQNRTESMTSSDGERYHLLKRVILPAMRFIRLTDKNSAGNKMFGSGNSEHNGLDLGMMSQATSGWSLITTSRRKTILAAAHSQYVMSKRRSSGSSRRSSRSGAVSSGGGQRPVDQPCNNGNQICGATAGGGAVWILHVRPMGVELGLRVIQRWLGECGRTLTQQQWSLVEKSFAHCSRPIFVKLAFGEIVNWKSYSVQSDTKGLRFGSSLLENDENGDSFDFANYKIEAAHDPALAQLICDSESLAAPESRWQIWSMEQQWLNYLDYKQRKEQAKANTVVIQRDSQQQGKKAGTTAIAKTAPTGAAPTGGNQQQQQQQQQQQKEDNNDEGTVVIRVGALSSARARGISGASSLPTSTCRLSNTIDDAICQLFARIELQHGYVLTKHSLSYITAARNGICENELEDILSLDDVVLDDVFQYHLPPVRRIPPLLWTRIRNDLPDYLSERDADGIVINWHHSQFELVARKRYLSDPQQVHYIHSNIADYFLGKWADKAKPFRCTRQQVQMAAEQLESAVQQSIRDGQQQSPSAGAADSSQQEAGSKEQQQQSGQGQLQQQSQQQSAFSNRASISGVRLGYGSTSVRSGVSFSVRSRLRSSDQHDQRLQWMQAKADRRVPHQPLYYSNMQGANEDPAAPVGSSASMDANGSGSASGSRLAASATSTKWQKRRYNLRKLTELPYHLMRSERFLDLASEVLFNYKWLHAALDALGLQSLLSDFSEAARVLERAIRRLEDSRQHEPVDVADATIITVGGDDLSGSSNPNGSASVVDFANSGQQWPAMPGQQQAAGELDAAALRSMLKQVNVLNNTIHLSCSALHSDTQMLAPQLIGRLLPLVGRRRQRSAPPPAAPLSWPSAAASTTPTSERDQSAATAATPTRLAQANANNQADIKYLAQLLDQCDKDGCSDCALLPTDHCLQSPDGLQLSSLEGHSFAIMSMAVATDQRHLLAVSNRFIMWDISTGQVSRDVDPKIDGSIMKQLRMGQNNAYAIAYTSDNVILVLDILTQQVTKFDGFRARARPSRAARTGRRAAAAEQEVSEQIIGLDLIDRLGATRFSVWTSAKWFVLRVVNNELNGSAGAGGVSYGSMPQRISVELEYCVDLRDDLGFSEQDSQKNGDHSIISVQQVCLNRDDLTFIVTEPPQAMSAAGLGLRLLTVRCMKGSLGWMCELWKEPVVGAKSLSLDANLKQLVYSDWRGFIYLRRRRATCWSKPKLIRSNSESNSEFEGEASLMKQLNSMISRSTSASRRATAATAALVPMAIELNPHRDQSDQDARGPSALLLRGQRRTALARFERQIDSLDNGDEIEENCVFEMQRQSVTITEITDADQGRSQQPKSRTQKQEQKQKHQRQQLDCSDAAGSSCLATKYVKLYYHNKIVVVRLDGSIKEPADREKILMFPRNIRNISVEPNKCQISSVILEGGLSSAPSQQSQRPLEPNGAATSLDFLVVAVKRKLLLYSIGQQQLLKSIDAHGSRIVQLIPIQASSYADSARRAAAQETTDASGAESVESQRRLIIASASMDKTVKIWNLNNLHKDVHVLDRLDNSIESISLTNQLPLAACLARGELGIWDWRTLRLLARLSPADLVRICAKLRPKQQQQQSPAQTAPTAVETPSRIVRCKFSSNDRYLCLATQSSVHLLSIEGLKVDQGDRPAAGGARRASASMPAPPSLDKLVDCRTNFNQRLPVKGSVGKLSFLLQDSRILVAVDCGYARGRPHNWPPATTTIGSPLESSASQERASSGSGTDGSGDQDDTSKLQLAHQQQRSLNVASGGQSGRVSTRSLTCRLLILCYTVPDGRLLYKVDCLTPTMQISAADAYYFGQASMDNSAAAAAQADTTASQKDSSESTSKQARSALSQPAKRQLARQTTGFARLPVVTRDQLHIVTVECSSTTATTATSTQSEKASSSGDPMTRKGAAGAGKLPSDRRKSSVATRTPVSLGVYSTRDGCLVRTINLNQVELCAGVGAPASVAGSQLQQHQQLQHTRRPANSGPPAVPNSASFSGDDGGGGGSNGATVKLQTVRATPVATATSAPITQGTQHNGSAGGQGVTGCGERVAQSISIGGEQFSRLKAFSYRERHSTVALIDDDKGQSYLIDVSSKQLVACSGIWNGKLSSDGRHGLSRMFKSAATALHRSPDTVASPATAAAATAATQAAANGASLAAAAAASAAQAVFASAGGLQLLEMHHCHPVKSLLTNETLSKLSGGSEATRGSSVQAPGSDTDITCGFTRPNDNYVYYYDSRLKRLLLIRVRDAQLISNYKLSAQVTKIKCANEGLALVLGLADGSLTSLAIVDEQKSDTLAYLAQYPSRQSQS